MKKIFTLLLMTGCSFVSMATDYTDNLEVIINGESIKQTATISVDKQADGKYTLELKNFMLNMGETPVGVGNIKLENVAGETENDVTTIKTFQTINITEGDDSSVSFWMSTILPPVPVDMTAEIRGDKLYTVIDIDLTNTSLNKMIKVVFGNGGYQIGNSDFEDFHTAKMYSPLDDGSGWDYTSTPSESDEPDYWHSFMTGSGYDETGENKLAYVYLSGYTPLTFKSNDVRPGSIGKSSVKIISKDLWLAIANGTLTTGRLNAGTIDVATDAQGAWLNHSWTDMSKSELGLDDKPFYSEMNGKPDALKVWVKFKQGAAGYSDKKTGHPYASIKAVINDGTYYQDPENTTKADTDPRPSEYKNVVAKATNSEIAECDWKEIVVPFDYDSYAENNVNGKVILVTASTNADAGCGGDGDELYLDDMSLVYNNKLTSLKVKGTEVTGFDTDVMTYEMSLNEAVSTADIDVVSDGRGAIISKEVKEVTGGVEAVITVTSNDLKNKNVYKVTINGATVTGINAVENVANGVEAVYDLKGNKVNAVKKGGVYVTKKADGKTVKVIKK